MHANLFDILRSYFTLHHLSPYAGLFPQKTIETFGISFVRKVAIMHDKLNDAVGIVNSTFSYEILPGMAYTSCLTISLAFGIFHTVYDEKNDDLLSNVIYFIWTWYMLAFLIAAIFTADTTTKAANDTLKILSRVINNAYDELLLERLTIFSHQINHGTSVVSCDVDETNNKNQQILRGCQTENSIHMMEVSGEFRFLSILTALKDFSKDFHEKLLIKTLPSTSLKSLKQ
ncbi:CLUMA_CG018785, isoform A [Clunio marinus]|uniref:CLUMA_CG018785, isoform A n=1 Tax=Clunio marinus TaxID=568069 RepID=A0A1J1J1W8_9DIPT|nr:CLUMA_CG018785, isoform A [Clunio marinus]